MFIVINKTPQVFKASSSVTELVKSTICAKVNYPHFSKPFYSPACTLSCSDFCGSKHNKRKPKCASDPHKVEKYLFLPNTFTDSYDIFTDSILFNKGDCGRGGIPEDFLFCPSADPSLQITFTSFEVQSYLSHLLICCRRLM